MISKRAPEATTIVDHVERDREREPGGHGHPVLPPDLTRRRAFQARQIDTVNAVLGARGAAADVTWLAFTPAYVNPRGAQSERLGAHAFREGAPRSLCGYVERERAGAAADDKARRCTWCERVLVGKSADRSST